MSDEMHTPLPWSIRPNKFDDWGYIRGSDGEIACCARGLQDDGKSFDDYRRDKIDPYQANAALIVRSVNALPALVNALEQIAACSICGYSLNGKESFDDLATMISGFNSALQKRVNIARAALASVRGEQ